MKNKIQNYAWGTMGKNAFIPKLLGLDPQSNKPYAELWMGDHPNAPSDILVGRKWVPLNTMIGDFPKEMLGASADAQGTSTKFPFLLKVLSIAEPLSIQAHPDEHQAKILHDKDPINYPDENHKPEIAIALDSLNAFVGFKDYNQLVDTFAEYPELQALTQDQNPKKEAGSGSFTEKSEAILRAICNSLIHISSQEGAVAGLVTRLEKRINEKSRAGNETEEVFLRLTHKYPGDIGLLFMFLLKYIHLKKGEAIFTRPGVPHAYVSGNIVECMAPSDNVVRAGLTPKYKDLKTLASILSYATHDIYPPTQPIDTFETVYDTPTKEFRISVINLNKNGKMGVFPDNSPEVLLITEGEVQIRWRENNRLKKQEFRRGNSILIPAFLYNYSLVAQAKSKIFKAKAPTQIADSGIL